MALLLPHSVFYHIPKTGGSWVRGAIQKAGIPTNEVGVLGPVDMPLIDSRGLFLHATPQAVPLQMFAFTFVRNPLSWYQSHWAYCTKNKRWNEHNPFERQCASDNFHQFLRNALTYFPGGVSNMYRGYLGEEYTLPGGFVGRQEPANLAARLDDFQHRCLYTAELLWEMMQSEGHAMRSLGYDREDLSCFLDQRKHSPLPATNHSTRS
ncbi:MAG: hypothetical protein UY85_C0014G0012 [Candidatus Peribacteria bacterium GW2011_GWB1_54_5]|nr:MAG: hypothetical protein UY85_C0014G0012 [Candidatus Peribacteria bacterium GW2011_GWB1_54_5]